MTLPGFLLRRRADYRRAFETPAGQAVLADLRRFCCATRSTYRPGDPAAQQHLEGRREVWLRIAGYLNLTERQIWQLTEERQGD